MVVACRATLLSMQTSRRTHRVEMDSPYACKGGLAKALRSYRLSGLGCCIDHTEAQKAGVHCICGASAGRAGRIRRSEARGAKLRCTCRTEIRQLANMLASSRESTHVFTQSSDTTSHSHCMLEPHATPKPRVTGVANRLRRRPCFRGRIDAVDFPLYVGATCPCYSRATCHSAICAHLINMTRSSH